MKLLSLLVLVVLVMMLLACTEELVVSPDDSSDFIHEQSSTSVPDLPISSDEVVDEEDFIDELPFMSDEQDSSEQLIIGDEAETSACYSVYNVSRIFGSGQKSHSITLVDGNFTYSIQYSNVNTVLVSVTEKFFSYVSDGDSPYNAVYSILFNVPEVVYKIHNTNAIEVLNVSQERLDAFSTKNSVWFKWYNLSREDCLPQLSQEPLVIVRCNDQDCVLRVDEDLRIDITVHPMNNHISDVSVSISGELLIAPVVNYQPSAPFTSSVRVPKGSIPPGDYDIHIQVFSESEEYDFYQDLQIVEEDEIALHRFQSTRIRVQGQQLTVTFFDVEDKDNYIMKTNYGTINLQPDTCEAVKNTNNVVFFRMCYPLRSVRQSFENKVFRLENYELETYEQRHNVRESEVFSVGDYVNFQWMGREHEVYRVFPTLKLIYFLDGNGRGYYLSYSSYAHLNHIFLQQKTQNSFTYNYYT